MRRGLILNVVSNVLFFVCGYAIHFFLGNTLTPAEYGLIGVIITVLDLEYMFLSNGARQSLAKEIALGRYDTRDVVRKSIRFQLILIAFFSAINFFGASALSSALNAPGLDPYFKFAALLIPANGLFVVVLGINDGLHRFSEGAIINSIYPIAKLSVIPIILFPLRDRPVLGMEVGYLFAVLLAIAIGVIMLAGHREELIRTTAARVPFSSVARNTFSFSIFFIMVSLVLSVDTLVVKAVTQPASIAGFYTGAVNLGKIPYYLVSAFCTVILPVVSGLVGRRDLHGAAARVREFVLVVVAFILPVPVVVSATAGDLLTAFYQPEFSAASAALAFLSFSSFFMGMTVLLNMVVNAFASSRFSDVLSIGSMVIVVPVFVLAARAGGMTAIALSSMICTGTAMVVSLAAVIQRAGNPVTWRVGAVVGVNVVLWVAARAAVALAGPNLARLALLYVALYLLYGAALVAVRLVPAPWRMLGRAGEADIAPAAAHDAEAHP